MKKNKISSAVVRRLPKYFRFLTNLENEGVEKISSKQLSEITGFTASQIRQDLNHFGGFGQQGYGYKVSELKNSIANIIGLNKEYNVAIVGFGHIGRAIYQYKGFDTKKFNVLGVFDVEEGTYDDGKVKIQSVDKFPKFLDKNEIDIVLLSVPKDEAQKICDMMIGKNVKGVWNFAPTNVEIKDIPVENIHLSESLYSLTFYMSNPDYY